MKNIKLELLDNQDLLLPLFILDNEENNINVEITLTGDNSKLSLVCIYIGQGSHKLTYNVKIVHKGKNTFSRTHLRSVLFGHSELSNDGLVRIEKGAKGSNTFYTSRILLFDDAKGRSVPSLEIDENQVTGAGHASSLGRPREEEIFYLQSRGLSKDQAERLIVQGFFEPLLKELPEKDKLNIEKKLKEKLGASEE
jgi:Fe-S cluster assembly protein SufD